MTTPIATPLLRSSFPGQRPRVIGHRGACGVAPENTLTSFQQALKDGADILEMDVHLTADGVIVVSHDPTVDRTTNGSGRIAELTYAQIRQLDAGHRFTADGGKTFPFRGQGITIPSFSEVLESFPETPMNVEIKVHSLALVNKFMDLLRRHKRLGDVMVVLVAAEARSLSRLIRKTEPSAFTGHSRWEVIWFLACTKLRMPWLFRPKSSALQVPEREGWLTVVTPNLVRYAHSLGMEVHVWTINEEAEMKRLLAMGVDAIFTDFPGRMRKLLNPGRP